MNPTQQEQLLNLGAYLRDVRQDKGKQIDEVANQIFIRPALVKAIEAGDWESLPEPVFVQGFIRRYAEYLGLDGKELSKKFEPTPVSVLPNPELAHSRDVEGVVKPQDKHGLKVLSKAKPAQNGTALASSHEAKSSQNWVGGAIAIAALIALLAWLTTRNTPQQATSSPPSEAQTAEAETPETVPEAAVTPEPATTLEEDAEAIADTTAVGEAPITFAVNIEDDAWLRVIADGERVHEGILTTGTQQTWTAETELRITAGNSGGVQYSFNGSEEQPMGAPGSVANLTLTPDTDAEALSTP